MEAGKDPQYLTAENIGEVAKDAYTLENGVAVTNTAAVVSGLKADDAKKIDAATVTPLPIFSAGVSDGGTAVISLKASLDKYDGKKLGDVVMLKLKRDGTSEALRRAGDAKDLSAASFIWTDASGNPRNLSDKVVAGRSYYISVAIEDDSAYDLDTTPGRIIDPLAMAAAKAPGTEDDDNAGGDNNGGGDSAGAASDGNGGGCSTGGNVHALFGLLCLAAIAFRRTRRSS
jgi:MYXO-CTERM domain-containing protein